MDVTGGMAAGGLPPGSLEEVLARVEAAVGDLASLVGAEALDSWDAPAVSRLIEAHTRVRRVTGRLDGLRYTLLPRIEDDGSWRSGGTARTFTTWLRLREGIRVATARKDMTIARRLATVLPATRERLVAGTLGIDHARVMTEVAPTSRTRTDALSWLVDTRTGEPTTPEAFVQTVPVNFPDPVADPDGNRTRELITRVLQTAVTDGTLVTGENLVLREAGVLNADQFRTVARRFATITDPDTDDTHDDKAAQGEFFDLSKTLGGYHLAGFLTDEHGLLVQTAITGLLGAPAAEDTRTPTQRRAQGLADIARLVLNTNQASPGASITPHLNVTVSWTELITQITRTREGLCLTCGHTPTGRGTTTTTRTGTPGTTSTTSTTETAGTSPTETASTVGAVGGGSTSTMSRLLTPGGPVFTETGDRAPRTLLRRLACDSTITRIVFGPDSAVLDVGRTQRTITGQLRRAVIARDQHCVYPGCDQPPTRCEVHHAITHWAHGGETSTANSALLCWHHHQLVDTQDITMHWTGKPNPATTVSALLQTGWAFTDTHGHRIQQPQPTHPLPPPTDPPTTQAA